MVNNTPFPTLLTRLGRIGIVLGVLGLLGLILSYVQGGVDMFYKAYLYGWIFWITMTFGCYGLMLLQNMVRANWGFTVIRLFEAGAKLMPIMGLAFIPIIIAAYTGHLYPWADPARVASDPVLHHRQPYMNPTMFMFRAVVYFAVFSFTTWMLTYLSREQDRTGNMALAQNRTNISAPSFVIMVLLITFAVTDWLMSLEPHWYSTIYGFWFCICCALTAMAFVALIGCRLKLANIEPYEHLVDPPVTRDWGNLLLMMVMVWAYFSLSQFLITWSGNLPEEVIYYYKRNIGIEAWLTTVLVTFQFFIPFLCLCSGKTKKFPRLLSAVCILLLCTRAVEVAWNVLPYFYPRDTPLSGQIAGLGYYVAAWCAVGGFWLFGFVVNARKNPLIPASAVVLSEVYGHAS